VLHALRDHLPVTGAVYVGEQLPMLIRGIYFEHWNPAGKPLPLSSQDDFFSTLSRNLAGDGAALSDAGIVMRAVFRLLERKVTDGEIEDIRHILPAVLVDLWPPTLRAA
jgi:uncharacterized protein (DUF2267 family)